MAKKISFTKIEAKKAGREHEVKVTIRVTENGNPLPGKPVTYALNNGTQQNQKMTNKNGYVEFIFPTRSDAVKVTVECEGEQAFKNIEVKKCLVTAFATTATTKQNQLEVKPYIDSAGNGKVTIRAVDQNGNGIKAIATIEAEGTLHTIDTNADGHAVFDYPRTLAAGESIAVRVSVPGIAKSEEVTLSFPTPNVSQLATIEAVGHIDNDGNGKIVIRVIDANGNGLKTAATVEGEGNLHSVDTDDNGHATFDYPRSLTAGESINVRITVPGIAAAEEVALERQAEPATAPARKLLGAKEFVDNKGNCKIVVRVIDMSGKGVKTTATIEAEGKLNVVKTNNDGNATFDYPRKIKAGEQIIARVSTPDIVDVKELTLSRPDTASLNPVKLEADVLHNGRGRFAIKIRVTDADGNGIATRAYLSAENQRYEVKTDKHGEVVFNYPRPIRVNETVKLIVSVSGIAEQKTLSLSHVPAPKTDPSTLTLRQSHDGFGNFTVFFRVTDESGNGLEDVVTLNYRGRQEMVKTDSYGQASWLCPDNIRVGDETSLTASISGIAETATIKLRHRRTLPPTPSKRSLRWWFRTNNGRAVIGLVVMLMLWIACYKTGPIFDKPTQQTVAQINDATIMKMVKDTRTKEAGYPKDLQSMPKFVTELPPKPGNDHGQPESHNFLYLFTLIWTIAALIYAPLSLREEIRDGFEEALEKIRCDDTKASDPRLQTLYRWAAKEASVSRVAPQVTPPSPTAAGTPDATSAAPVNQSDIQEVKKELTFWKRFKSDVLSDLLVEAAPKILSRIFR